MAFSQFTSKELMDNYGYAKESEYYVGHPLWDSKYPLTMDQCITCVISNDFAHGILRTAGGHCFCNSCSQKIGNHHLPTCRFSGPVGNNDNLVGDW